MQYCDALVALEESGAPYVVVGSMAVALGGEPCEPHDLDVVIAPAAGDLVAATLIRSGFYPTLPLGLQEVSVMRFLDQSGREIDIFMRFAVPFDELFADSRLVDCEGASVRIASRGDLIRARERTGR